MPRLVVLTQVGDFRIKGGAGTAGEGFIYETNPRNWS